MKVELDLEGGQRHKEIFLWDKNEPYMTVENFARILCEENGFNTALYEADITS